MGSIGGRKMRKSIFFTMLGSILILALATLSCVSTPRYDTDADIAAVGKVWDAYAMAVTKGDATAFANLWTDDAIKMIPNIPIIIGKANIMPVFQSIISGSSSVMKITTEETVITGDLAYSRGSFEQVSTSKADGSTMRIVGKFLDILARQPDGSWKITIDCFNFDGPPTPVAK
jgi:uncharacterized protein (TIGR02246 family)